MSHRQPRPQMRAGDIFRVVAIDDKECDLRCFERLAAQAEHPRCVIELFEGFTPSLVARLAEPPDLIFVNDDLAGDYSGEASIASLRELGFSGAIVIVDGVKRPQRCSDLVRAGAMFYLSMDDLELETFLETIDMAMAVHKLMRARRHPLQEPANGFLATNHGEEGRSAPSPQPPREPIEHG